MMDYIYRDEVGKKQVWEIQNITAIPYYQFTIKTNKKQLRCHLDHALSEWQIHFVEIGITIELAHPRDTFWNTEALLEDFDEETARKIAYGIKTVYDYYNDKGVSL
jgi:hypothetical protein